MNIIKRIKNIFSSSSDGETYELGQLQKYNLINELPDLSACPNCRSKNIAWKFFIHVDGSSTISNNQSVCQDCGYRDVRGEFEKTNKLILRDGKINQILDGI